MNVNDLVFFDKNGESYNFSQNDSGYWEGADYFLPISIALFDCSNIFILQKNESGVYKFPEMEQDSKFEVKWKTQDSKDNFFLFTVYQESFNFETVSFLQKQDSLTVSYDDFGQTGEVLDLTYPFQINVAFNPIQEVSYSRVLQVYYTVNNESTLILEMTFYGEGEDEDERLRIWLQNFGVKFNKEDALLLKDYDLKESLPDWQQINTARKGLLVNIDQVYPYVGTYKGLLNLLSLLGYKDVLRVKEYWKDSDPNSLYYEKFAMVDVTDLMMAGESSSVDFVDANGQIKRGGKFKKTEFLALAYEFTVAGDTYDDDGLPEVVETTQFSVNEMFFKLNGIARKVKDEILPINVLIKDVIGEFIYFDKFNLRNWPDTTFIESTQLADSYEVKVLLPNPVSTELMIRDIKSLYPKLDGTSEFPYVSFNSGEIEPYQDQQVYDLDQMNYLISAIEDYYESLTSYKFHHIGETIPFENGDDTSVKIGCPIILEAYVKDLTLQDLDGITFGDFVLSEATTSSTLNSIGTGIKYFSCASVDSFRVGSKVKIYITIDISLYMEGVIEEIGPIGFPANTIKVNCTASSGNATGTGWTINLIDTHYTIGNIKYKNAYELEWVIDGPKNYHFEWRDSISNINKIPHVLPYTGEYIILARAYDMHGGVSMDYSHVIVSEETPRLESFVRLQDKNRYDIKSLSNVTIGDLGDSPLYNPYAVVINVDGSSKSASVNSHYLDWFTYSNFYGVGTPMDQVQILEDPNGVALNYWGTGSANGQPVISDYSTATMKDLRHMKLYEFGYIGDILDGFYIDLRNLMESSPSSYVTDLQFGGFSEVSLYTLMLTPEDLVNYLQNCDLPGWKEYRYEVVGERVKASAKVQTKKNHSIIKVVSTLTGMFGGSDYVPSSIDLAISSTEIKLGQFFLIQKLMAGPSGPFWNIGPSSLGPSGFFWLPDDNPSGPFSMEWWPGTGPSGPQWPEEPWPGVSGPYWWPTPSGPYYWLGPTGPSGEEIFPTVETNTNLTIGSRLRVRNANGGYIEGYVINMSDYEIELDVDLINEVGDLSDFDLALVDVIYTFNKPKKVFNEFTMEDVQETLLDFGHHLDEDLLFLTCPFTDRLMLARQYRLAPEPRVVEYYKGAPASDIRYWIDKDCVRYDNDTGEQTGFLPSEYDQNAFTLSNARATYDTIIAPVQHPVFVIISNLTSNVETIWTLYSSDGLVVKLKTTSYFVWRFEEPGEYRLTVESTDSRGNVSTLREAQLMILALSSNDYNEHVEQTLNDRKYEMTH